MTINSVNNNPAGLPGMNQPATTGPNKSLGQQDFLRLMVAQVQHQDPMEPQTNGDFMAQLAQFSTNDGITKMQESIQDLAYSFQSNQALQASSLVGRKVLVNSDGLNLGSEGGAKVAVDLPAPVSNIVAEIYGINGELMTKVPLGQRNAGQFEYTWDGMNQKGERMQPGRYTIKVNGLYEGQQVALKTLSAANVDSVSLGQNGEGVRLNVAGIGAVNLNDVKQITA